VPKILLSHSFPVLRPKPCDPESAIKKKEDGKDGLYLFGKIRKPGADKHINPQYKI